MSRTIAACARALALLVVVGALHGCEPTQPAKVAKPLYCFDEAALHAMAASCTATSRTRPESEQCRVTAYETCGFEVLK